MEILQFPNSSWDLTVLKNIFLRFIGLKGLKMVWKKSSLIWNIFPDFGWKIPVFPWFPWLEKVFKNFPEFPDFPDRWEPCWSFVAIFGNTGIFRKILSVSYSYGTQAYIPQFNFSPGHTTTSLTVDNISLNCKTWSGVLGAERSSLS